MSARDDYPPFVGAHRHGETSKYEAMCDEIDHLRAEVDRLRQRRYELLHEVADLRRERVT